MNIRTSQSIFAFSFALMACFYCGSCFVGCTPRTPTEQDEAIDKVLHEIGIESNAKAAIDNPNLVESEAVAPSIVKQQTGNSPVGQTIESSTTSSKTKTKDFLDPITGRRQTPKIEITVDDPSEPWGRSVKLPRETWEVQYLGNAQVGFVYRKVDNAAAGLNTLRHEARSRMRVSLKGIPFEQRMDLSTIEQDNGEIRQIWGSLEMGANKQSFEGTVRDGVMKFIGLENGQPFSLDIEWKESYRGPFAVEQSMRRRPLQPGKLRTLKYFDPFIRKIIDGRLEASEYIMTPTMLDGTKDLLEVRSIGMVGESGSQALLWVDKKGEVFKSLIQANDIMSYRTEPIAAQLFESIIDLRAIESFSIPLKGPIDVLSSPTRASVKYRFHHRSEQPFPLFSDKIGQQISSTYPGAASDPKTVYVTVRKNGGGPDLLQGSNLSTTEEIGASLASEFVPSHLKKVIEIANGLISADQNILPGKSSNTEKANSCRREIQKRIALKEFDKRIGTVLESLKAKQANCIEHALLFASICRAIDIPTRIAMGVKFNQSAEMPEMKFHAWVEIRDGSRWVPMDSTEEAFPTSIDRIKIKESNFNAKNPYLDVLSVYRLLPELEIQVLPQ